MPQPNPAADRNAGFRYRLSVLQAEFSLTQILDQVDCRRRPMQDAHSYRGGHPFAARLLQKHAPQAGITRGAGAVRACVPKPPLTIATTSALGAFWATCPSCARSALPPTAACSSSRKQPRLPDRRADISQPRKARRPLRASAPALYVLATRACSASSPCFFCSASSSKASATGNCGPYLPRCSGWKKATSVRAA